MEQIKIQEWVKHYLEHINEVGLDNHVANHEGYKFQAVEHFQKHFDIEAIDIRSMLDNALLNNNLVVGAQFWPKRMMLSYAEMFPEEVRAILKALFDESVPVATRLTKAQEQFEELNNRRDQLLQEGQFRSSIQLRFLSLLLGFRYPNNYNPLKPSEWKFFCRFVDPDFSIPRHTLAGDQYQIYNKYIEPLRAYIKTRPEITAIKKELTKGLLFQDDEYRWMTQNVIYKTAQHLAAQRAEKALPEEIYKEEPVNDSDAIENLSAEENTGYMALEKHLEDYVVRNWDLVDFGEKLELYTDEDGTVGQQYVTDVGIIDILAKDSQGNFVVLELKRADGRYQVVGQILNYMSWVRSTLAINGESVRGVIVVGRADNTLRSAVQEVSDKVSIKEYRIKLSLLDV